MPGALSGLTGLPTDSTAWVVRSSTGKSTVGGSPVHALGYGFRVDLEMDAEYFEFGDRRDAGCGLSVNSKRFMDFCEEAELGRYLLAIDWEESRGKPLSHAIAVEVTGRGDKDVAMVHSSEPFKRTPVVGRHLIDTAMGGIDVLRGWRLVGKSKYETW